MVNTVKRYINRLNHVVSANNLFMVVQISEKIVDRPIEFQCVLLTAESLDS